LGCADLLTRLNDLGGANGIGRVDLVENRFVGMKSRGVYETPGGTILRMAHQAVESITMDREVLHLRDGLIPRYASLIYNGFWFSPEMRLLQETMDAAQDNVWGRARLKLYKGSCQVVGRKSTRSLYRSDYATFEKDAVFDQSDAEGFIKLLGLRLRLQTSQEK
jgi:argininosuccinate synthase